jgi:hypothetical protein
LPKPANTGVLKRKIIVVPWTVNSSLYAPGDSTVLSDPASCRRITSAMTPPTAKKMKHV